MHFVCSNMESFQLTWSHTKHPEECQQPAINWIWPFLQNEVPTVWNTKAAK